jgi:hypothetical protein
MSYEGAEARVKSRVNAFIAALLRPDREILESLTAPGLNYENREQFVRNMLDGGSRFLSIELTDESLSVLDDVAIVRHILFAHTHDKGRDPGTIRIGILLVWRLEDDEWLLLARQAFRLPQ